jgi:hypothetical protein
MSIVRFAEVEVARDDYDRVFCVFDRDGHSNYDEAIQRVRNYDGGRAGRFETVASWPCFEIWLLLHFAYSSAPFNRNGRNSACDQVVRALKRHLVNYAKGDRLIYDRVAPHLEVAISNAGRLEKHNRATGSFNPSTKMHYLVDYLRKLKD